MSNHSPQTTLHRKIIYSFLSGFICANIAQGNYLSNVGPWLTDNVYYENNLCNVVSTILGQHCIRILSSQCCANTCETIVHKKTTCPMLAQSAKTCFCRKTGYSFKCLVACFLNWYNIIEQSWVFLFNVCSGVYL